MPVSELQREVSSSHFTELKAYKQKNTLNPDQWGSVATGVAFLLSCFGGKWVDPDLIVPGKLNVEQMRNSLTDSAERSMDRQAEAARRENNQWQESEN